jgi:hypothetical protein
MRAQLHKATNAPALASVWLRVELHDASRVTGCCVATASDVSTGRPTPPAVDSSAAPPPATVSRVLCGGDAALEGIPGDACLEGMARSPPPGGMWTAAESKDCLDTESLLRYDLWVM